MLVTLEQFFAARGMPSLFPMTTNLRTSLKERGLLLLGDRY